MPNALYYEWVNLAHHTGRDVDSDAADFALAESNLRCLNPRLYNVLYSYRPAMPDI